MKRPAVSVIVPLYNYADLLPRALDSIMAQRETDWECVIVDDASTDDGADVAGMCAENDERFRLVCHDRNLGLSAARNTGFAAARGRYLMLLDPDDEYLPHAIGRLLYWMRQHPETAMAFGNFRWPDGSPGTAEPYCWETLADHDYIPCQATMLDRYAREPAGWNDTGLRHAEDWDWWLRVAAVTNGAVQYLGDEPLYQLNIHDRQKTRDVAGMREHDAIIRERAERYGSLPNPIHVAHASFPLTPHGAQQVLWQIIRGTPGMVHTVYVPEPGGEFRAEVEKLAEVRPLSDLADARPDVFHVHDGLYPEVYDYIVGHRDVPTVATRHGLADVPNFVRDYDHCRVVRTWDGDDGALSIANGADLSGLEGIEPAPGAKPTVMTCARFASQKRPLLFAETCAELEQRRPGRYRYLFVGGSETEPLFAQTLAAWSQIPGAEWVPNCTHAEVLAHMRGADVFLLCSDSETRPLSLMEAVACGVPAIAADAGGIATIEGLALVLPVGASASAWADAVQEHIGRSEPRRYELNDGALMARRYEWLYRSMLLERC